MCAPETYKSVLASVTSKPLEPFKAKTVTEQRGVKIVAMIYPSENCIPVNVTICTVELK